MIDLDIFNDSVNLYVAAYKQGVQDVIDTCIKVRDEWKGDPDALINGLPTVKESIFNNIDKTAEKMKKEHINMCSSYHIDNRGIPVCWGTKETEQCSCDGYPSKCDFYEYMRKRSYE